MPSDNLEELFKENIEAVAHKLPPGCSWHPEAAWAQLPQTKPVLKKGNNWFKYAAAFLLLLLAGGLLRQYLAGSREIPKTVVANRPGAESLPLLTVPEIPKENILKSRTRTTHLSASPTQNIPQAAAEKKRKLSPKPAIANTKITTPPYQTPATLLVAQAEPLPVSPEPALPAALPTPPAIKKSPLKITIVLGAKSSEKMLDAIANQTVPGKKKKSRLRLNTPGTELAENNHFALTDSANKSLKLQARINF